MAPIRATNSPPTVSSLNTRHLPTSISHFAKNNDALKVQGKVATSADDHGKDVVLHLPFRGRSAKFPRNSWTFRCRENEGSEF
jgi:hypothetical protein